MGRALQISRQKESAALLACQQLLAEEEQEKTRLAAKIARKQKAKAKKQQPQEQQLQQEIIQAEADLDSLADSDCLKAPTAIIETAAPESADPSTVDDDDWSVRNAAGLSAKQGWKAALGVDMVNRTTAVSGSRQGNDSTPLDSVMAASAQLTPRPQPQAGPSVTPEVHISLLDSKGDQTMMDLFLCPITKVMYCGLSLVRHSCCNNRTPCLHTEMSCLPLSWLCLAGGRRQLYQLLVAVRFSVITCSGIDEGPSDCC